MEAQNISGADIQSTNFSRTSRVERTIETPSKPNAERERTDTVSDDKKGKQVDSYA
jgi:hypothetical protein